MAIGGGVQGEKGMRGSKKQRSKGRDGEQKGGEEKGEKEKPVCIFKFSLEYSAQVNMIHACR